MGDTPYDKSTLHDTSQGLYLGHTAKFIFHSSNHVSRYAGNPPANLAGTNSLHVHNCACSWHPTRKLGSCLHARTALEHTSKDSSWSWTAEGFCNQRWFANNNMPFFQTLSGIYQQHNQAHARRVHGSCPCDMSLRSSQGSTVQPASHTTGCTFNTAPRGGLARDQTRSMNTPSTHFGR